MSRISNVSFLSGIPWSLVVIFLVIISLGLSKIKSILGFGSSPRPRTPNADVVSKELSRSAEAYKIIAEGLFQAMNGLGTDTSTVFRLVEGLNDQELKHVYNVFGWRGHQLKFGITPVIYEGDLITWFENELGGFWELGALGRMKTIWQGTGIWT